MQPITHVYVSVGNRSSDQHISTAGVVTIMCIHGLRRPSASSSVVRYGPLVRLFSLRPGRAQVRCTFHEPCEHGLDRHSQLPPSPARGSVGVTFKRKSQRPTKRLDSTPDLQSTTQDWRRTRGSHTGHDPGPPYDPRYTRSSSSSPLLPGWVHTVSSLAPPTSLGLPSSRVSTHRPDPHGLR